MQQQELVRFLYDRVLVGIPITLFVTGLMSILAYIELSFQGREQYVVIWFLALCALSIARMKLQRQFSRPENAFYFAFHTWRTRFSIGAIGSGVMLGFGAAMLMPYVTTNLQIILHSLLLGMSVGAIAYLATSLRIYMAYLISSMLPVTIWLFMRQTPDGYLLSFLYLFMMIACSFGVRRVKMLINEALYYRFDNEALVEDLQGLLSSVSESNKTLEKISTTDELTGSSNHKAFRVHLEEVVRQYRGLKMPVSLAKLNVDYFHEYNSQYGIESGDQILGKIARWLMAEMSDENQMVARLKGTEFAVIMPGASLENARLSILRVVHALKEEKIEHTKSKVSPYLTVSVGLISQLVQHNSTSRELLGHVDLALKTAVEKGRNRIEAIEH